MEWSESTNESISLASVPGHIGTRKQYAFFTENRPVKESSCIVSLRTGETGRHCLSSSSGEAALSVGFRQHLSCKFRIEHGCLTQFSHGSSSLHRSPIGLSCTQILPVKILFFAVVIYSRGIILLEK